MRLFLISILLILVASCTSSVTPEKPIELPGWDGEIQQWGTLREVMHGEVLDGQVRLSDALDKPHLFGIGAPDKLQGEILIAESVAWVTEVREAVRVVTRRSNSSADSAVLLAIAQVPRWKEVIVDQDVPADQFDEFVANSIRQAGLDNLETVPFVVEGHFSSLDLHVLNGQCPFAEVEIEIEGTGPPLRTTLNEVPGLLVGFYAENGAGKITHHWTRTHVHALVGTEGDRSVGHVDEVSLKAGTTIRVPEYHSGTD